MGFFFIVIELAALRHGFGGL